MTNLWTRTLIFISMLLLTAAAIAQQADKKTAPAPAPAGSTAAIAQQTDKKTPLAPAPAGSADTDARISSTYKIGPGDVLAVAVWKEPELSLKVPVRPDGMITLPLIGDIKAAASTSLELQATIEERLKSYISSPAVTVIVDEVRSHVFNVLGQVQRPGTFPLAGRTTVLDGLAQAGGLRDFAKSKKIYVMRTLADGTVKRLPFNYKAVIKGQDADQNVELQSHDTIVVP